MTLLLSDVASYTSQTESSRTEMSDKHVLCVQVVKRLLVSRWARAVRVAVH